VSDTARTTSPQGGELTEEVSKVVIDCIVEFAEVDAVEVTPSATLEELDVDSLDLVEIAQVLEERFGIVIEQAHMKDVTTVGDAIEAIVARIKE
jgi:acyl carrier protein